MNRSKCYSLEQVCTVVALIALIIGALFVSSADAQDSSPPIMVVIDLHADPMAGPPPVQELIYRDWLDATNWMLDVAEPRGAAVSFLSTGQFFEWALSDPADGHPVIQRLYASGGQIATHSHNRIRVGPYDWVPVGDDPPPEIVLQLWDDHVGMANATISAALGVSDPGEVMAINCMRGSHVPSDDVWRIQLMADYGFSLHQQGPDEQFYAYFQHYPMNPYRPSGTWFLQHDPDGPVVVVPFGPVLGKNSVHFGIVQDMRVPAVQARFLLEVLNWLHDNQVAHTGRVWVTGWGSHCHDVMPGTPTRDAVEPMLDWLLEHFVGKPVGGQVATVFAGAREARDAYYDWESSHPGRVSFSYPAEDTNWHLYPYLAPAAVYLSGAWYETDLPAVGTVRWHVLTAAEDIGGPYALYVAYTTNGVSAIVDLADVLGPGQIAAVDPATGCAELYPTDAVRVKRIGTILVPQGKVLEFPIPGDLNDDGVVGQADLGILLADWGCTGDCAGDVNADGTTNQRDLGILLANWGRDCP